MSACDRLDEYLCGWLATDERVVFERHLAECANCQAERELQQQTDRVLARFPESISVPADLAECVVHRRRIEQQPRVVAVAVAVAIALAAALGLMMSERPREPAPASVPEIVHDTTPPVSETDPRDRPDLVRRSASLRPGDGMIAVAVPTDNPTVSVFQFYSTVPRSPGDDRTGSRGEIERTSP